MAAAVGSVPAAEVGADGSAPISDSCMKEGAFPVTPSTKATTESLGWAGRTDCVRGTSSTTGSSTGDVSPAMSSKIRASDQCKPVSSSKIIAGESDAHKRR